MSSIEKKSVLVDATSLRDVFTGLGQFSHHLIGEFAEKTEHGFDFSFLVHPSSKEHLGKLSPNGVNASWLKRHAPRSLLPSMFPKYDLWHAVAENTRFTSFPKGTKVLFTLHGLHFLDENPADVARKKLAHVQQLVDKSDALATVSAYTDVLVRKNLEIGQRPMKVIHHGVGPKKKSVKPLAMVSHKFIFSIGNFFERKNFHVLIPFLDKLEGYQLVLAGDHHNQYGEHIKKEVTRLSLTDRVSFLGRIGDEEKYWLYQHCDAFVFPSFSEGFGIPVIEAMQAGKPVFCSQFGSLPEIGNGHAYYWEHFDPDYMKDFFLTHRQAFYREQKNTADNIEYAKRFTWRKAAESYLSYYAELTK